MGVVHKLKKEVIDFILNSKRDNPKLGCRKLAEVASEKFEIKISKSSVNSIIKSENLSNSVGRPKKPKVEKKKKFEIPTDRKMRISKELTSIPLPVDQPKTNQESSEEQKTTKSDLLRDLSDSGAESVQENGDNVQSNFGEDSNVQKEISSIKQEFDAVEAIPITHAGLVFLKLAIQENLAENFFENILSGINVGVDSNVLEKGLQAEIYKRALGASDNKADIDNSISLFCMNQNKLDINSVLAEKVAGSDAFSVLARGELEIKQLYSLADTFSLTFSNGTSVKLDASLNQIGHKNRDFYGASPMKVALKYLDDYIAGNQSTLIVRGSGESEAITDSVLELMRSFELSEEVFINEIEILDKMGRSLTNLPFIVPKKRFFAYGVYPEQSSYQELIKMSKWAHRESVYSLVNDQTYSYSEMTTDVFGQKIDGLASNMRLCCLWATHEDQPMCVVVTNQEGDLKPLIINYLQRYPKVSQQQEVTTDHPEREEFMAQEVQLYSVDNKGFDGLIEGIKKFLEEYIVWQYFDSNNNINSLLSNIYDISGSYRLFESIVYVTLNIPKDDELARILTHAIERVNQRVVQLDTGERILLRLK